MAIFKKFIGASPRHNRRDGTTTNGKLDANSPQILDLCVPPSKQLDRSMMRCLLFSEQGFRLLFDSETVVAISDRIVQEPHKISQCKNFQFLSHRPDIPQISQMVFGTMATSMKTGSLKIHMLRQSNALMVSCVFSLPKSNKPTASLGDRFKPLVGSASSDSDSYISTIRSLDGVHEDWRPRRVKKNSTSSSEIPDGFTRIRNSSLHLEQDGGVPDELRAFSPSRLSRLRRKEMSFKGLTDETTSMKWSSRSRLSSESSTTDTEETRQFALALIFNEEEKEFIFHHILQLEKDIRKFQIQIYRAITTKNQFLKIVYAGWTQFCSDVCLLHNAMRLKNPVWLSLMEPGLQNETASKFCATLVKIAETMDNKETKYFFSTLLSTVLMHHLAWVASVAPPENCSYGGSLLLGTSVINPIRNPYNALMAQFLELCGNVGFGKRHAKTIILGDNPKLITEILYILSYFIRCAAVENRSAEVDIRSSFPTPCSTSNNLETDDFDGCPMSLSPPCLKKSISLRLQQIRPDSSLSQNSSTGIMSPPSSSDHYCVPTTSISIPTDNTNQHSNMPPPPLPHFHLASSPSSEPFESGPSPPKIFRSIVKPSSSQGTSDDKRVELVLDLEDLGSYPGDFTAAHLSPSSRSDRTSARSDKSTDFGRSLLAGVCTAFSPHFVISGIDKRNVDMNETYSAMYDDVKYPDNDSSFNTLSTSSSTSSALTSCLQGNSPFSPLSSQEKSNTNKSTNGESDSVSSTIITADTTTNVVRVLTREQFQVNDCVIAGPSDAVVSMLEQFVQLYKLRCAPTFLLSFLEDQLGGILTKSQTLVKLVTSDDDTSSEDMDLLTSSVTSTSPSSSTLLSPETQEDRNKYTSQTTNTHLSIQRVSEVIGCDCSDLRLIVNVAAVYSPPVLSSVI